ncbi:MAG: DNA-protecting protein DprA [Candidatus Marinimicrobia bacterium]|nr:DNA-protecting protein DprA [Candidatus Neomarinimicrobiota bacterium]
MIPKNEIFALSQIKGVGPSRIHQICRLSKNVKSIFDISKNDLYNIGNLSKTTIDKLSSLDIHKADEILKKNQEFGCDFFTFQESNYPKLLNSIYNPPVGIFVRGNLNYEKPIAIVGTRNITPYGKKIAIQITTELVNNGFTIVSGFARGIDSICHNTTVNLNGKTIAVLASGLNFCYPKENKKLYNKMWQNNIFLSEYPIGHKPEAMYFPKRNRIISGLSLGTIVIEAGEKSGAVITAYNALEQNRDVFAVPGRIDSKASIGCNKLIKNGAKPVLSVNDILESYQYNSVNQIKEQLKLIPELTKDEKSVYDFLSHDPIHIDELSKKIGINGQLILSTLLTLELNGIVVQLPGKMFVKN